MSRKNLAAAEENLRILTERFNEGLERVTDVLKAETLLSGAKLEYQQSIYNVHIFLAKIAMDCGFETTDEFIDTITIALKGEE